MITRPLVGIGVGIAVSISLLSANAGAGSAPVRSTAESTPSTQQGPSRTSDITIPGPPGIALLRILVTNDDGVDADGLDAIVEGLLTLENVEVTVIAPATNQSGTGSNTSPDPTKLMVIDATTKSGYPAKAVVGSPADTVVYAIDFGGYAGRPDLVISGINKGENVTFIGDQHSGTIGAARAAAARGLMAIAASQGVDDYDYPAGVEHLLALINEHRAEFGPGDRDTPLPFVNLNVPSCAAGTEIRGEVIVPLAQQLNDRPLLAPANCASTLTDPADDLDALSNGFVTITEMPAPDLAPRVGSPAVTGVTSA